MNRSLLLQACLFSSAFAGLPAVASPVDLQSAASYAVLAGSTVTNTGPTTLLGDLGVSPGTAITGFFGTVENDGPGVFTGTSHQNDVPAQQARADTLAAFNALGLLAVTENLTGQNLGGLILNPGVYNFDNEAALTGVLTLVGSGNYVFQIGSTLTTAANSSVVNINGANPFGNVFWQVGSSATLGTGTKFAGNILADQSITLTTGASVDGRLLAINGAVTLDTNFVAIPEPATVGLLSVGVLALGGLVLARRRRTV